MTSIIHDLRAAIRTLSSRPVFTAFVVGALALGIGATTAIYSIVDGILLRPLPYESPDELVIIGTTSPSHVTAPITDENSPYRLMGPSLGNFLDWRARLTSITGLVAVEPRRYDVRTESGPEPISGTAITPGFFELLGIAVEQGRSFADEEHRTGSDAVAILSHGTWVARFGADPAAIGRTLDAVSGPLEIVGVLPASFQPPEGAGLGDTRFWVPLAEDHESYQDRGTRTIYALGRLMPDASLTLARDELWTLSERIAEEHPDGNVFEDGTQFGTGANRLHEETTAGATGVLLPLLGAVGLLLLIACANVANLCLAQGIDRQRELAIRAAMGAGRGRIVRQLLTESLLLAGLAGAAGVALAHVGVRAFVALSPGGLPRMGDVGVDIRVLSFAVGITALTGITFGLFPAVHLSRSEPGDSLKLRSTSTGSPGRQRFRTTLVIIEAALAVILSIGVGLLFNSFVQLRSVDPGFDPAGLTTFVVSAPGGFGDRAATIDFQARVEERLARLPGVERVATASNLPLERVNWRAGVRLEGETEGEGRGVDSYVVSGAYFATLGVDVLQGRVPDRTATPDSPNVIAVNRAFADELLGTEQAVGTRVHMAFAGTPMTATIVGVVENVRQIGLSTPPRPALFGAATQLGWPRLKVIVRSVSTPTATSLRQAMQDVEPDVPVTRISTLRDHVGNGTVRPRFYSGLMASFAVLALVLAVTGIYSATLYAARARTHEAGVRMALGALPGSVRALIVRQGMRAVTFGVALGIVGSVFIARFVESLLYGIEPTDVVTFATTSAVFIAVAFVANWVPARYATRVDVLKVLRGD